MKHLSIILIMLILGGCVGKWHGSPYKQQTTPNPLAFDGDKNQQIIRNRSKDKAWWQQAQIAPITSPTDTTDPDEKWQKWSEQELAPTFPKDWKPAPKENPDPEEEKNEKLEKRLEQPLVPLRKREVY